MLKGSMLSKGLCFETPCRLCSWTMLQRLQVYANGCREGNVPFQRGRMELQLNVLKAWMCMMVALVRVVFAMEVGVTPMRDSVRIFLALKPRVQMRSATWKWTPRETTLVTVVIHKMQCLWCKLWKNTVCEREKASIVERTWCHALDSIQWYHLLACRLPLWNNLSWYWSSERWHSLWSRIYIQWPEMCFGKQLFTRPMQRARSLQY